MSLVTGMQRRAIMAKESRGRKEIKVFGKKIRLWWNFVLE